MCKLLDIQKTHTTTYHPQSDGMVERLNRTLTSMLSAFVNSNWNVHLPYIMMAYRSSVHDTTGMTPNTIMFGREVATPLDLQYEMPSQIKETPSNKWVWELQERLENAHAFVRNKMNKSMFRHKHYHDRKLKWKQFEDGEEAYVFFPRGKPGASPKSNKLLARALHSCQKDVQLDILSKLWPKRFRLSDPCRSDAQKVQASFTG